MKLWTIAITYFIWNSNRIILFNIIINAKVSVSVCFDVWFSITLQILNLFGYLGKIHDSCGKKRLWFTLAIYSCTSSSNNFIIRQYTSEKSTSESVNIRILVQAQAWGAFQSRRFGRYEIHGGKAEGNILLLINKSQIKQNKPINPNRP